METTMRVGALAARTGVTVRTLHHYDDIGLLSPGRRTAAGHRLYGEDEIRRLQQIASLRHLGLTLDEIKETLSRPDMSIDRVLELQIERIDGQIVRQERLRDLIRSLRDRLRSAEGVSVEELTRTIGVTMSYEKYYTPAQLDQLARRREEVGEQRIREVEEEWRDLFAAFGKAMEEGRDPASQEVRALARRSASLIEEFTGADPGIRASLGTMYRSEGPQKIMSGHAMEMAPGLWEYMGKAGAALEEEA
jgi:DNA-binding transcriptional MerR regulator